MRKPIYKNMILGAAYYPEHWDQPLWEEDIIRMKEYGLNLLRIGDFAWSKLEPREDVYHIEYFDNFLQLCKKHQIDVIFCTPTAAPPMWLTEKYPEALNCDMEGKPYYGPRRHYNYNSKMYQKKCAQLVEKLAHHYGNSDVITGWQIDNELNCDLSEFYSQADHQAFREYLKEKYQTLDAVNDALGLTFWSRSYSDWSEVTLNRKNVGGAVNPHIALEEKAFFSESAIRFCRMQVEILKKYLKKDEFITTNGLFPNLDYNKLMDTGLDFITFDSYPNFAFDLDKRPKDEGNLNDRKWSWNLAWTRSVSPVFGIMEQQAGANGWSSRMETPMPKPGQMRLWSMQSVAHGADMIAYFRWRTSPIGCEIYWHGLNDYSNTENRRLKELKDIAKDFKCLEKLRGTTYKAKVAVLKDYRNTWDAASDCWHGRIDYLSDNNWFAATQLTHTPCDFYYLRESTTLDDLLKFELLVYPHAAILEETTSELLKQYVESGGTLVFGARTGYKDRFGRCPIREMPGIISDWTGVRVADYTLVGPADGTVNVSIGNRTIEAPLFNEVLEVTDSDTEVLGKFDGNYYKGSPAITVKKAGKGKVYYVGACFSEEMVEYLLENEKVIEPYKDLVKLPKEIELAVRTDGETDYIFLLNYQNSETVIRLEKPMESLLEQEYVNGELHIKAFDIKVLIN